MSFFKIGTFDENFGEVTIWLEKGFLRIVKLSKIKISFRRKGEFNETNITGFLDDKSKKHQIAEKLHSYQIDHQIDPPVLSYIENYIKIEKMILQSRGLPFEIFRAKNYFNFRNIEKNHNVQSIALKEKTNDITDYKYVFITNELSKEKIILNNQFLIVLTNSKINVEATNNSYIRIEKELVGNIKTDFLVLGAKSKILGNIEITSQNIRLDGHIEGDIKAKVLTLGSNVFIEGNILADLLIIESGATLYGESKMTGNFKEKK